MTKKTLTFRYAERKDTALILKFIKDLARYEKLENEVVATEALLEEWLFEKNKAEVIFAVAEHREIGFALFFHNFSTFLGRAGIYLEDLYVLPEYSPFRLIFSLIDQRSIRNLIHTFRKCFTGRFTRCLFSRKQSPGKVCLRRRSVKYFHFHLSCL